MIHFEPVGHHIHDRAQARLCDGKPAGDADISSEDWLELREARRDATLCPDCQDEVSPRDVHLELYGYGRMSTAHLYAVPVLSGFDAVRNCSHCRRETDGRLRGMAQAPKGRGRSQAGVPAIREGRGRAGSAACRDGWPAGDNLRVRRWVSGLLRTGGARLP